MKEPKGQERTNKTRQSGKEEEANKHPQEEINVIAIIRPQEQEETSSKQMQESQECNQKHTKST